MSKFIRNLALFVAGLPFATTKAAVPVNQAPTLDNDDKAISLRPLNLAMDNLFASHRSHSSHSSHASHSSHYSGSGSYSAPAYVAPTPVDPAPFIARTPAAPAAVRSDVNSSQASVAAPSDSAAMKPVELTLSEKRRLQVLRVQMRLNSLKLYDGQITGVLDDPTRESLKLFQAVKSLPVTGTMTTPTLNALGIPAVR
jgi:His-Xaa-Ser repeat protein HxsA